MARKLKTYQTSLGFFDLAVAAPTMKAALEAWGSRRNLFHQGFAAETNDPAIVAATMAKPGVVLKRAVGSNGAFTENAALPKSLPAGKFKEKPAKVERPKPKKLKVTAKIISLADARATRRAAAEYEKERERQDRERRGEEAAAQKQREIRKKAAAKAEAALEKAREHHEAIVRAIDDERAALDRRSETEEKRWDAQKRKLQTQLRRAGDQGE